MKKTILSIVLGASLMSGAMQAHANGWSTDRISRVYTHENGNIYVRLEKRNHTAGCSDSYGYINSRISEVRRGRMLSLLLAAHSTTRRVSMHFIKRPGSSYCEIDAVYMRDN